MTTGPDEIRTNILKALYDAHQNAKSMKKAALLISEIQRTMKALYKYKQQEVSSNLDYLVQIDWVKKVVSTRSVPLKSGTTVDQSRETYKISALGIDKVQGASLYKPPAIAQGVNITNVAGVVVTGAGNVVNTTFSDAAKLTAELRKLVAGDLSLPAADKIAVLSDVDSLAMQLQKPVPNKPVLQMLWNGVQAAAAVGGAVDLLAQLGHALAPILAS